MRSLRSVRVVGLAVALAVGFPCEIPSANAQNGSGLVPPLSPSADEILVRGVAAFSLHVQLNECVQSAERLLTDLAHAALNAHVGDPVITVNQKWGYLLRADFTRDDVASPLVNRIMCWADGQIIASKLSVPPLTSFTSSRQPLAVPGVVRH